MRSGGRSCCPGFPLLKNEEDTGSLGLEKAAEGSVLENSSVLVQTLVLMPHTCRRSE